MVETVTQKRIISAFIAFIMMIVMIAGAVDPKNTAHAAEDYRTWSQKDDRWANTAMGGSTIRESGCYVTSIAMVAAASGARDTDSFDPGVFARQLNNIGAFSWDGSLMYWASVNAVIPEVRIETANLEFTSYSREGKAAEMESWLNKGYYVICNVGGHWVYVDSISGGCVTMADPAKTETDLYSVYNDIYYYQVLSGKEPYGSQQTETLAVMPAETTTTTAFTTTTTTTTNITTTTTTTTTTTMTTTTTTMTTAAVSTVFMTKAADVIPTGEYYYSGNETVNVYTDLSENTDTIAEMQNGDIVNVTRVIDGWGCINIDGTDAWVKLSELVYAGDGVELVPGDISGDGAADAVDLAVLNNYIRDLNDRPEGISTLRRCEIEAADISGDGIINDTDVLMYLMLICK